MESYINAKHYLTSESWQNRQERGGINSNYEYQNEMEV